MEAIKLNHRSNAGHYHWSIDVDMNIIINKVSKVGTALIIASLIIAFFGMFLPIGYLLQHSLTITKSEVFWVIAIVAVSATYMLLVILYHRRYKAKQKINWDEVFLTN